MSSLAPLFIGAGQAAPLACWAPPSASACRSGRWSPAGWCRRSRRRWVFHGRPGGPARPGAGGASVRARSGRGRRPVRLARRSAAGAGAVHLRHAAGAETAGATAMAGSLRLASARWAETFIITEMRASHPIARPRTDFWPTSASGLAASPAFSIHRADRHPAAASSASTNSMRAGN